MTPENFKPKKDFNTRLENTKSLPDIFEVVKAAVWECHRKSRGGLMLGLANLGNHPEGFFGGFYPVGSNVIVMNKIPLERIKETRLELYKPYAFHVLLHEYLHTLGYMDESDVRKMAHKITKEVFGEEHLATKVAANTAHFFHNLVYPGATWQADEMKMELVGGFDRESASYIC
ncbi:hypothetical protein METP2_03513 [Methanosarcinales archaeon]|nr:hypothetical protein [Candidatus Methanoperedens sp. BLZ2]KAB2944569.1 MAG: hypothetical protein F9K14_13850 [Candidatus Methanoperedens sp.]MBZ0176835.1 hypothetical protein [Candidatus Methanoperedens nitroreducens]CAG1003973.1 hypothetical protein METP2_03513 [Methanosarcinales archaeon]MCX9077068.1 hypothetical protein [Candidatus Methanoperedens sp.]MCX9087926.1 hypothetical protein [Candidatus Methanoperedens sp.]